MIENKLFRIEQRPEHIFQCLLLVLFSFNLLGECFQFLRGRLAADASDVKIFNHLRRCLAFLEKLLHHLALRHAAVDRVAQKQMQGLRQVGLHHHFTGANRIALGAAKGREEVRVHVAIGDLHGASAQRQALEFVLRFRHLRDHIEQHFRTDTADVAFSEVGRVEFIGVVHLC